GYQIIQNASRTTVGYPIGYFYGYIHDGIYQSEADIANSPENTLDGVIPGDIRYKDVNNDGRVDVNDRTMIGNPTPDFTYGASVALTFKQFDFGVELMGVQGNEIFRDWNRNLFAPFNYQQDR